MRRKILTGAAVVIGLGAVIGGGYAVDRALEGNPLWGEGFALVTSGPPQTKTPTLLGDCPPNTDACIRPSTPTATAFRPVTSTPRPTATPYAFPTPIFTDAVEAPPVQDYYLDRGAVGEYAGWVFVLMGTDTMPHRRDMGHTDTFVIVLVNLGDDAHVSLVSVPRDLHVYLPGYGMTRINNVWTLRGSQGLKDMLRYNFGLRMDGYLLADMDVLRRFIDEALGGVTVEVPEPVLDRCGDLVVDMLPGPHEMDGALAVCYARVRLQSSDYPRMLRQQSLLVAMRDRALTLAGTDPFGFFIRSFIVATDMGLEASVDFFDLVEWLWPGIEGVPGLLASKPETYRMMPPFSVHFNHPVTGAWLLAPPTGDCMAALVDRAWLGKPWLDESGNSIVPECPR